MSPIQLRLRELRDAKGWTQAELAEKAGIRRATVNRIENAKVTAIDLAVLEKLASALGVNAAMLVDHTTAPSTPKSLPGPADIIAMLREIATADLDQISERRGRRRIYRPMSQWPPGFTRAVASIRTDRSGKITGVTLHSVAGARRTLSRMGIDPDA